MSLRPADFKGAVADNVLDLIGRTPVVRITKLVTPEMATVYCKLERQNPGGCVKERTSLSMIQAAEREGRIRPGDLIVEPTSGNTGIGLAMVAAFRGYRLTLVMPDNLSVERRKLFKAYGADVVLTSGDDGMRGAIEKAEEIVAENDDVFMPNQFENPANPDVHYTTTGPEILAQVPDLDAFVATAGTGGTVTGVGRRLHEAAPNVLVIAVEPAESPVLSGGEAGQHDMPGMGPGFIPDILDMDVIDEVVQVRGEDGWEMTRRLAREEGLLVGISSGAATFAALEVARQLGPGKNVVALLADTGERYLSTGVFDD